METKRGQYFSLNAACFLITGAVNAAIYDLSSGDVYAVDGDGRAVLELTEQGFSLDDVLHRVAPISDLTELETFLDQIENFGLGQFHNNSVLRDKIDMPPASIMLQKIWLELTVRCNLRCLHCYADASPQKDHSPLDLKKWQAIIVEGAHLGAQWIQLIGGEPLLFGKEDIFALITQAKESGYQVIEIFSNGLLIDDEYVDFFAQNGVQVALSVYAKRAEVHDRITQCPGSFQRTMANAKKLQRKNMPVRFSTVVMSHNVAYEQETLDWIQREFEPLAACSDVIRCTTGGRNEQMALLTPELWRRHIRNKPNFRQIDFNRFVHNKTGHPCLCGAICIQADGRVYPCIMDRTRVLGDVSRSTLEQIVNGPATEEIWGLTKDQVAVCRDCEFRYACTDCRPFITNMIEVLAEDEPSLQAKDPCCLYDPYEGHWGKMDKFMEKVAARGLLLDTQLVA